MDKIPDLVGPNQRQSTPGTPADIRDYLRSLDGNKIFQEMTANPDIAKEVLDKALAGLTPEHIKQAAQLQNTPAGDRFLVEKAAKAEVQQEQRSRRGLRVQVTESNAARARNAQANQRLLNQSARQRDNRQYQKVVHMGPKRKLSEAELILGQEEAQVQKLLKAKSVIQIPCPKLGPTIRVWYMPDFNVKFKHVRATKIVGFPVGGEFLFFDTTGDLTTSKFTALEANINVNDVETENELTALADMVAAEL